MERSSRPHRAWKDGSFAYSSMSPVARRNEERDKFLLRLAFSSDIPQDTPINKARRKAHSIIKLVGWRTSLHPVWPSSRDHIAAQDLIHGAVLRGFTANAGPPQGQSDAKDFISLYEPSHLADLYDFVHHGDVEGLCAGIEKPLMRELKHAVERLEEHVKDTEESTEELWNPENELDTRKNLRKVMLETRDWLWNANEPEATRLPNNMESSSPFAQGSVVEAGEYRIPICLQPSNWPVP